MLSTRGKESPKTADEADDSYCVGNAVEVVMRGVNNRNFFHQWQILYRATCPSLDQTHWHVGDVEWKKDRHSFAGSEYAVTLEVHCLRHSPSKGTGWKLLVMIEYWWNGDHEPLRSTTWARVTEGNPKSILAWLARQQVTNSSARNALDESLEIESPAD
jgi:hypothetical protein